MAKIQLKDAVSQILAVLQETFEGPKESWSYFTDNSPESGYFGTLQRMSAADASRSESGSSIVSHVHHVVFALNEAAGWIRGDRAPRDWKESWKVQMVDESAWTELLERLRSDYSDLQDAIETNATDSVESIGGAVGVLAHAAFHLGAIRQKVWLQRNR